MFQLRENGNCQNQVELLMQKQYQTTLLIACCVRFQWQWRIFVEKSENMSISHLSTMRQYRINSIGYTIEILSILIVFYAVNRLMILSAMITRHFLDEKPLLNVVQLHTISIVSLSHRYVLDQIGPKFCPRQLYKCDIISSTDIIDKRIVGQFLSLSTQGIRKTI